METTLSSTIVKHFGNKQNKMDPPRSIRALSDAAHDYEFSTNTPIKVYLRTADTINRHADLFLKSHSFEDSYILYLRFLDLVVNKISKYPKLKQDPDSYKRYLNLVHKKVPIALKSAEKVKASLDDQIQKFEAYNAKLKHKNKIEELKRQLEVQNQLKKQQDFELKSNKNITSVVKFDDAQFNQSLKQFLSIIDEKSKTEPSYPSLPEFHHYETQLKHEHSHIENGVSDLVKKLEPQPIYIETSPVLQTPQLVLPEIKIKPPEHKSIASTEGGVPLKTVFIPNELEAEFLKIASSNTSQKLETCGILCGKLSNNAFFITTLLIPDQDSTSNTCSTTNEEAIFEFIDSKDLFVLGWIHTHPTQTCFLSSVDLHTQNSYQIMLPEAMAIVCAPRSKPNFGVFRLTDPKGIGIITKCQRRGFHPHEESDIYRKCSKTYGGHVVLKKGLPFECSDLRTKK